MKGYKFNTSTIISFVILIIGIVVMFILLNFVAKEKRAKSTDLTPTSTTVNEETTTTLEVKTNESDNHFINSNDEQKATNFNTSLASIVNRHRLSGKYDFNTTYRGARFNFKCTDLSDNNKCSAGSATIDVDGVILPLYTFEKEDDDYTNHSLDYYIINSDKYIILTYNYVGKYPGELKIYDKTGTMVANIKNVITGYIENDEVDPQYYPVYTPEDNTIAYYMCRNNQVKVNKVNIDNVGSILLEENVDGVRCY